MRHVKLVLALAIWVLSAPIAFSMSEGLQFVEQAVIASVVDGDTISLSDGRQVRLVGIQAPKLPLGRKNFAAWPLAQEAKRNLETLIDDQPVKLWRGGAGRDRHGRVLAHIQTIKGKWLQEEMLLAGFARVYSFADNRSALAPLYQAERAARAAGKGIWSHSYYQVFNAEQFSMILAANRSRFVLVEGTLQQVTHRGRATYLDFGDDWRTDFSARILSKNRRNFGNDEESGKAALDNIKGQPVRVRGWAYQKNGIMIDLDHIEAIEMLTPAPQLAIDANQ